MKTSRPSRLAWTGALIAMLAPFAGVAGVAAGAGGCLDREPHRARTADTRRAAAVSPLPPRGDYGVQSVSYDDAAGTYQIFLLSTPAGVPPLFRSSDVRMARLDDAALAAGKKSYLEVGEGAPVLHLTPDFQIAYQHSVTEERVDESTGQREIVVVRQESSTWSPFLSGMAGAAVGNMLFAPHYYYPPPYSSGPLFGYGGFGQTRSDATQHYVQRFGTEPQASRLSRTGTPLRPISNDSLRTSGRGAGASRLERSRRPAPPSKPIRSFGSRRR